MATITIHVCFALECNRSTSGGDDHRDGWECVQQMAEIKRAEIASHEVVNREHLLSVKLKHGRR